MMASLTEVGNTQAGYVVALVGKWQKMVGGTPAVFQTTLTQFD